MVRSVVGNRISNSRGQQHYPSLSSSLVSLRPACKQSGQSISTAAHANLAGWIGIAKTGIWLLSTGIVITNLGDYWNLFAYLAGYGIGTLAGMHIEKMISLGHVIVRLISPADPQSLITELSALGYGMTRIEGSGGFSNTVTIIFMIVPRNLSRTFADGPFNTSSGYSPYRGGCAQPQGRSKDLS